MMRGPSALSGGSSWPARATTIAVSNRSAAASAAAKRSWTSALVGSCCARAMSAGMSAGLTAVGRGARAQPPATAKSSSTHRLMRLERRPSNFGVRTKEVLPGFSLRRPLRHLRFRAARRLALAFERCAHLGEDAIALLLADEAAAHGVAQQLLSILRSELADPGRGTNRLHQVVRDRTPQHAADAGNSLKHRSVLRPAELACHRPSSYVAGGRGN